MPMSVNVRNIKADLFIPLHDHASMSEFHVICRDPGS